MYLKNGTKEGGGSNNDSFTCDFMVSVCLFFHYYSVESIFSLNFHRYGIHTGHYFPYWQPFFFTLSQLTSVCFGFIDLMSLLSWTGSLNDLHVDVIDSGWMCIYHEVNEQRRKGKQTFKTTMRKLQGFKHKSFQLNKNVNTKLIIILCKISK